MRVLHLDSGREMRGGQWQALYLLRGLRERGHEVSLLARRDGRLLEHAIVDGFQTQPLSLWALRDVSRAAGLIHAHDAHTHTLAALASTVWGKWRPLVVVSRRVAFPVRTGLLSRWKYRRADHYLAISRAVAGELAAAGIKSEAISVVHDGVPAASKPSEGSNRVVAVATGDPMKGSDLLREAARLAGCEIQFSSDLLADLPHAKVFVYISRSEGLGSAALLAMAHGVPVIASRVGGLPEAVEDGTSGLLVDNRADDIAQALRSLSDDPALAQRLGSAGRKRVEQYFSLDQMVDSTILVYRKLLDD
jgi:glycosyltransferase involved in cell wall biosynthesis